MFAHPLHMLLTSLPLYLAEFSSGGGAARAGTEMHGHHGCIKLPYTVLINSSDVEVELNSGVSENQAFEK